MQVGKDRLKGYFIAGFHPASILRLTTPFSIYYVPLCILCPLAFANGFAVTSVEDLFLSKKMIQAKSGQDRPRPTKNLKITWTGLVPLYNVC